MSATCNVKSVLKVLGKMSDSHTSYIASVNIVQRAGNAMPQMKYAKKFYICFSVLTQSTLWWPFFAIILIHIHQT